MYVDPSQAFVALNYTVTSSGVVVAGVAGQKVRILALVARAADGTTEFESNDGTAMIGPITFTSTLVLPFSEVGWGDTKAGEALKIALSGSDSNTGVVVYAYVA